MFEIDNIIQKLEQQRAAIEKAIAALRGVTDAGQPAVKRRGRPPQAAKASAGTGGRQRQIEAMRRYWAAKKSGEKTAAPKAAAPKAAKKRTLSAAGRKALSDNMKRRWAEKKKAAGKKS